MEYEFKCGPDTAVVNTKQGKLRGYIYDGIKIFKGIPFWPASTPEKEHTLMIDRKTRVVCNHDEELIPVFAEYMAPVFARKMEEGDGQVQH